MNIIGTIAQKMQFAWHYWRLSETLPYPPRLLSIEPTNACNLKCPMCPQAQFSKNKIRTGFMKMELFRRTIDMAAEFQPKICLNLGGESTLHPEIADMVEYTKSKNLFVYLTSNGTKLTSEISQKLVNAGLDRIIIDFDGDTEETYKTMRDNADLDAVTENVKALLHHKKQAPNGGPELVIQNLHLANPGQSTDKPPVPADYILQRFQGDDIGQVHTLWGHNWSGDFGENKEVEYIGRRAKYYYPCLFVYKFLAVSWDGLVFVCCIDMFRKELIGDVKEQTLMEVWNSDAMRRIRRLQKNKQLDQLPVCQSCDMLWSRTGPASIIPKLKLLSNSNTP